MTGDIKFDGDNIIAQGKDLFFNRGQADDSVALNLQNSTGFWHISGPRSYETGNPLSIFWNDNNNWHGPFFSINTNGNVGLGTMSINADGNVGIGTMAPVRKLHIQGSEIHSGSDGAGYSFSDRNIGDFVDSPTNGERWVWYAAGGTARLWSGSDKLSITKEGNLLLAGSIVGDGLTLDPGQEQASVALNLKNPTGFWHISGPRTYETGNPLSIFWNDNNNWHGPFFSINTNGDVRIGKLSVGQINEYLMISPEQAEASVSLNLENITGFWHISGPRTDETGNPLAILWNDRKNWYGPFLRITTDGDVSISGNLTVTTVAQTSSRTLKENIVELTAQEAIAALTDLDPVKFNFTADNQKQLHVGFIAEDVPELVAMADRKTLSSMDIVAVLTKVVQEQQQAIEQLTAEVKALKQAQANSHPKSA